MIDGFLINQENVNFLWATVSLMHGLGAQNDMSSQTKDALRVCNVNIRKFVYWELWGHIS